MREIKYLSYPKEESEHVSLESVALSEELVDFTWKLRENMVKSLKARFEGKGEVKNKSIYVTKIKEEEQKNIENWTKKEITKKIFETLQQMDDNNSRLQEEVFNKTVKSKSKEKYIEFFHKIQDSVCLEEPSCEEEHDCEDLLLE